MFFFVFQGFARFLRNVPQRCADRRGTAVHVGQQQQGAAGAGRRGQQGVQSDPGGDAGRSTPGWGRLWR